MKLISLATIAGASIVQAYNDSPAANRHCADSKTWKRTFRPPFNAPSEKEYAAKLDSGLHSWFNSKTLEEKCDAAREMCASYDEIDNEDDYDQKLAIWDSKFASGYQCAKEANQAITTKILCSLCDYITDEAAEALTAKINSEGEEDITRTVEQANAGFLGNVLLEAAEEAAEEGRIDLQLDDATEVEGERFFHMTGGNCGGGKTCKFSGTVKQAFGKVTPQVWNIVVSGGPEYCKDMMPRYPRVNFGKMKPGHPNYDSVVAIRDSCVNLQKIVAKVKCACIYALWGSSSYPRESSKKFRDAHGKREAHMCWYFSNLKGTGVYRPKKKPLNTNCPKPAPKPQNNKKKPSNFQTQDEGGTDFVTHEQCKSMRNKNKKRICFNRLRKQGHA